ncbi:MAG: methylated-DNA--[protein]-cysteine S-methyltransferase [bacterium]
MLPIYFARLESSIGPHWVLRSPRGLVRLTLPDPEEDDLERIIRFFRWRDENEPDHRMVEGPSAFDDLREWMEVYLSGGIPEEDPPLDLRGTPFQEAVWEELTRIPYGTTRTYGEIARRLDRSPGSARAVGGAVGANPVPLVVPCHRVVGEHGGLVGFGGGLGLKERLLKLEGVLLL